MGDGELKGTTYAAEAAKISCLLALVNREMIPENSNVETSKMPMHTAFSLPVLMRLDVTW